MILENVCDFNHAFLHRKFKPFTDPHLLGTRHEGDIIYVDYETDMSQSRIPKGFLVSVEVLPGYELYRPGPGHQEKPRSDHIFPEPDKN
jgi:hypothetical protein